MGEAVPICQALVDLTKVVLKSVCKLQDSIAEACRTKTQLKPSVERMQDILKSIDSALTNMSSMDMKLDLPRDDIHKFLSVLRESHMLINASLREGRAAPAQKMKELEDSMLNFYLVDLRHLLVSKMMMLQIGERPSEVDTSCIQSREIIPNREWSGNNLSELDLSPVPLVDRLRVPPSSLETKENVQAIIVGPQNPVVELKGLIEECESPLVISAPPGHGKTNLARKVCQEASIKDKYGDYIFFLHVSATPNVAAIVCELCKDINHRQSDKIPSGTSEIRELEYFIKNIGISDMLLVLDDVWCEWEFLIDEFNFQISGYKLLVTSRFRFSRFVGYELTRLCQNDGQPFYFQSSKYHSDPHSHHVNKGDLLPPKLPVLLWRGTSKKNSIECKPMYVENLEGMTKSVGFFDEFQMEENHAYVLPSNYSVSGIMGDSSNTYGPSQE